MQQKYLNQDNNSENFNEDERYYRAKKRIKELKGFYWHFASYVVINIFLIALIAIGNDGNIWNFGTFATAFFWGIGLIFHFLHVFGPTFFFGRNWEERKIKEYMDKDKF